MKRLATALVALALLAPPATAGRIRMIVPHTIDAPATDPQMWDNYINAMRYALERKLGCYVDVYRQDAIRSGTMKPAARLQQKGLRDSLFTDDLGRQQVYVGQILMGWWAGQGEGNWRIPGYFPDTLTLHHSWPQIPTMFAGPSRTTGGSLVNSTATCSTSARGLALNVSSNVTFQRSSWLVGTDLVWKGGPAHYRRDAGALRLDFSAPGITRVLVATASSNASYGANGPRDCDDCDGFPAGVRKDSQTEADTAIIWVRERSTAEKAPLVFAPLIYPIQGFEFPYTDFALAVAEMHRASGGRIIGQRPDWEPIKIGVGINNALVHSTADGSGDDTYTKGIQPGDSTYVLAHRDSLIKLGLPLTVFVNADPDTLNAYPNERGWWAAIPGAKFSPSPRRGLGNATGALFGASANASGTLPVDIFGHLRARVPITIDRLNSGTPCDGTDTTMSCLIAYSRDILNSYPEFTGRLSRALYPHMSDYVPANMTARDLTGSGTASIEGAMLRARFNTGVISATPFGTNPSANWGIGAGFTVTLGATGGGIRTPRGVGETTVDVWGTGAGLVTPGGQTVYNVSNTNKIGRFRWVVTRTSDLSINASSTEEGGHPLPDEFFAGLFTDNWYPTQVADSWNRSNYYYHTFRTNLSAIVVQVGDLGSTAAAGRIQTPGWWYIKHVANRARAINRQAGMDVFRFVYIDEL